MRLADFEAMIRRMTEEVPAEYLEGVVDVTVSRPPVPHPVRADIYTLGECIPLAGTETEGEGIQSRIVLYHGSFAALAGLDPDFDWREEAWETLTHELRHHLEWRAGTPALEALDRAAEANFARMDGESFDPLFHHDGERVAEGIYRIEQDYFLDRELSGPLPERLEFDWHGTRYVTAPPAGVTLPLFLSVEGVRDPPPGDLVLVIRRRPRWRDLFASPPPVTAITRARPVA